MTAVPDGADTVPPTRPVPALTRIRAQARMELRLSMRNAENLLVTLVLPVGLLAFFSVVPVLDIPGERPVDFLTPGVIALAAMGSGMVALAIGTGFERSYLVLKRLGATPLRRGELVAAKALATSATLGLQLVVVCVTALLIGWRPDLTVPRGIWAVAIVILGTAAFAGAGMALAGSLRALATLAVTNGLFALLTGVSGVIVPLTAFPGPIAAVGAWLPPGLVAGALRELFGAASPMAPPLPLALLGLVVWAVASCVLAARVFRWE